jgi:hypothetical protein
MSTKFTKNCAVRVDVVMPLVEAYAKAQGRALRPSDRSEIERLVQEWEGGNLEALEALKVWTGAPVAPAKPAAPAVNEETDLGRALMESGRRSTARSPFFSESVAQTVKEITEDAGIRFAPGLSDEIARMPLVDGDSAFHTLTRDFAKTVSFGGRRLDG